MQHVECNLRSALYLDTVANRSVDTSNANLLLARIQHDFSSKTLRGQILLTKTEITSRYAHHAGRPGAWTTQLIFHTLIPILKKQNKARLSEKKGKGETYAFKAQD